MGAFDTDFAFGALGVDRARQLLGLQPGTRRVLDLQEAAAWQRLGVDLLWEVGARTLAGWWDSFRAQPDLTTTLAAAFGCPARAWTA